jgi:hypothetical protein
METATLSGPEKSHIERMAESSSQSTMQERQADWMTRSALESKKQEKEQEGKYRPREISLKGRDEAQREWIEKVGEKIEPKESAKESSRHAAEKAEHRSEHPFAKAEKPIAAESTNSEGVVAPLSGDRHWVDQGSFTAKEAEAHWKQVQDRVDVGRAFVNSLPEFPQIDAGFVEIFNGQPPAWQNWFIRDLKVALAEVPNPGEVMRHIGLHQGDRNVLRGIKHEDWKKLRADVQTISKYYAAESQASARPRAPKPPSEVGGREAAGDEGTRGEMTFSSFSQRQHERYAHTR